MAKTIAAVVGGLVAQRGRDPRMELCASDFGRVSCVQSVVSYPDQTALGLVSTFFPAYGWSQVVY